MRGNWTRMFSCRTNLRRVSILFYCKVDLTTSKIFSIRNKYYLSVKSCATLKESWIPWLIYFLNRSTTTYDLQNKTGTTFPVGKTNNTKNEPILPKPSNEYVWIITILGLIAIICVLAIMYFLKIKSKCKLLTILFS